MAEARSIWFYDQNVLLSGGAPDEQSSVRRFLTRAGLCVGGSRRREEDYVTARFGAKVSALTADVVRKLRETQ